MATHWPHILPVTLSCLLALATLASAEDVWVLWSESWLEDAKRNDPSLGKQTDSKWEVLAAAPSSEAGEKARRDWVRRYDLVAGDRHLLPAHDRKTRRPGQLVSTGMSP
jgi:hypothetical protein